MFPPVHTHFLSFSDLLSYYSLPCQASKILCLFFITPVSVWKPGSWIKLIGICFIDVYLSTYIQVWTSVYLSACLSVCMDGCIYRCVYGCVCIMYLIHMPFLVIKQLVAGRHVHRRGPPRVSAVAMVPGPALVPALVPVRPARSACHTHHLRRCKRSELVHTAPAPTVPGPRQIIRRPSGWQLPPMLL